MKRDFLLSLVVFLFLGLFVCKSARGGQETWPAEYRLKVTTKIVQADYKTAFSSILKVIADSGHGLAVVNTQSGVIVTDYQSMDDMFSGRGKTRWDFNISKEDDNSTKVSFHIHCIAATTFGMTTEGDNLIEEDSYRRIFDAIDKEIKEEQAAKGNSQE